MCCPLFSTTVKPVAASEKSDGYNMSQVLKYYGQKKYKKAQRYNKKLSKYAEEPCVRSMTRGMKKEYLKIVKRHNKDAKEPAIDYHVMAYYLTDIDNNGNAELIVQAGETMADARFHIYRYEYGHAKKLGGGLFCVSSGSFCVPTAPGSYILRWCYGIGTHHSCDGKR